MKGPPTPSRADLEQGYEELQWQAHLSPERVALLARWSRFDARLAELVVSHLAKNFQVQNPFALREVSVRLPMHESLLLLSEFAGIKVQRMDGKEPAREFNAWEATLMHDARPGPWQMFFVNSGTLRPEVDRAKISRSLKPYLKWGYFGVDDLASIKQSNAAATHTHMRKLERLAVLETLIESGERFCVNDYLAACRGLIHRRSAERDLETHLKIKSTGFTRGRAYERKNGK